MMRMKSGWPWHMSEAMAYIACERSRRGGAGVGCGNPNPNLTLNKTRVKSMQMCGVEHVEDSG